MSKGSKNFVAKFLDSNKEYPVVAGLAAGLYPVVFYFSRNFSMLDTWGHFFYFTGFFIVLPIVVFLMAHHLSKLPVFKKYKKYVLPFLSLFVFLFILKTLLYIPIERKIIVYSLIASFLFARFFHQHHKKLIIIQFILVLFASFTLGKALYKRITYSDAWKEQPDDIENVVFKTKPNVYFFEPDGYVGFNQLREPPYSFDNSQFESFLDENSFSYHPDFRTNYTSTLASNGSLFTMKHHYYDFNLELDEVENATKIIISDNPVLNAFKRNGYETYFLSETDYFLLNNPAMGYDHCNIDYSEIAFLHNGIGERKEVVGPFKDFINDDIEKPKFFFVQLLHPWHIRTHESSSVGEEEERIEYLDRLEASNEMLREMIAAVLSDDPDAIIMIMADHGGFVGFDYTTETYQEIEDPTLTKSVFKSLFSMRWPRGEAPAYDDEIDSPVNVFRVLFAYLSGDEKYLNNLQPDESFIIHEEGLEPGVYKYFNDQGNMLFEKMEPPKK